MSEPQLPNKIEGKLNYDNEKDYQKIYESDMDDWGWVL
jgi:hypothetical protein